MLSELVQVNCAEHIKYETVECQIVQMTWQPSCSIGIQFGSLSFLPF